MTQGSQWAVRGGAGVDSAPRGFCGKESQGHQGPLELSPRLGVGGLAIVLETGSHNRFHLKGNDLED